MFKNLSILGLCVSFGLALEPAVLGAIHSLNLGLPKRIDDVTVQEKVEFKDGGYVTHYTLNDTKHYKWAEFSELDKESIKDNVKRLAKFNLCINDELSEAMKFANSLTAIYTHENLGEFAKFSVLKSECEAK